MPMDLGELQANANEWPLRPRDEQFVDAASRFTPERARAQCRKLLYEAALIARAHAGKLALNAVAYDLDRDMRRNGDER